jgi:hypothetical protein
MPTPGFLTISDKNISQTFAFVRLGGLEEMQEGTLFERGNTPLAKRAEMRKRIQVLLCAPIQFDPSSFSSSVSS